MFWHLVILLEIIRILYVCRVEIEISNPRNDLADRNRGLKVLEKHSKALKSI